jgi:hypothetical protein
MPRIDPESGLAKRALAAVAALLLMAIVVSSAFGTMSLERAAVDSEAREASVVPEPDRPALGRRFAPILYLNPAEPFGILTIIPVFHPSLPLIAYHVFFEEDALLAGRGKSSDHEIVYGAPPDAAGLSRQWQAMWREAREIVAVLPPAEIGKCLLNERGDLFVGDSADLRAALAAGAVRYHEGRIRGALPQLGP